MKARVFAFILSAIVLGAAALAGSADDIDNCCFVDRQCSSDQEWNDGYWAFQNNQCPATAQSQPTGGAPAQVDNCCFVDRLCNSDQEWTDGYWAYQNNQCGAPSQTPASSQPTGGAPAQVDNCCFVDRQCSSDQEWNDGYWAYQNNQCSAPTSSQPTGGAPSQIDNCCYVDRHCSTELDWISGYHAYQNHQCRVAGQSQTLASSQPAGGGVILRTASGIVYGRASGQSILPSTGRNNLPGLGRIVSYNNCCHLHWQCNSDQDWAAGYQAFQNDGQCALPGLVSIVGDPDFVDFYTQRLDQLRTRLPHRYNYVLAGLDKIEMNWMNLADNVIYRWRTFVDNWNGRPDAAWDSRMSAVLVHEACHVHRLDAGYGFYTASRPCDPAASIREEIICREMELAVVTELGAEPHVIEWARGMVADTRAMLQDPNDPGFCPVPR